MDLDETMETSILVLVFPVALFLAWKYFAAEHFGRTCGKGAGCNCGEGDNLRKFLEDEKKRKG